MRAHTHTPLAPLLGTQSVAHFPARHILPRSSQSHKHCPSAPSDPPTKGLPREAAASRAPGRGVSAAEHRCDHLRAQWGIPSQPEHRAVPVGWGWAEAPRLAV